MVMFDGYDSGPSTKDNAHLRRTREHMTQVHLGIVRINNNECEERYVPFKQLTIFHFSAKQKLGANGLPSTPCQR